MLPVLRMLWFREFNKKIVIQRGESRRLVIRAFAESRVIWKIIFSYIYPFFYSYHSAGSQEGILEERDRLIKENQRLRRSATPRPDWNRLAFASFWSLFSLLSLSLRFPLSCLLCILLSFLMFLFHTLSFLNTR